VQTRVDGVVKCEKILSIIFNYIYFHLLGQPLFLSPTLENLTKRKAIRIYNSRVQLRVFISEGLLSLYQKITKLMWQGRRICEFKLNGHVYVEEF
jgi:hypothetical protein